MLKKGITLATFVMLGASSAVLGQAGESIKAEMALVDRYTAFAGSQQNALALVNGLRNGAPVSLQPAGAGCAPVPKPPAPVPPAPPGMPGAPVPPAPTVTLPPPAPIPPASFTPPTGVMGYGNVGIAMDLAQQQLAKAGFTKPTPLQLRASFVGGTVTSCAGIATPLEGILTLRAGKEGWGRIASRLGLALSEGN